MRVAFENEAYHRDLVSNVPLASGLRYEMYRPANQGQQDGRESRPPEGTGAPNIMNVNVTVTDEPVAMGRFVRIRRGVRPLRGFGGVSGEEIGLCVNVKHRLATACFEKQNTWRAFVDELEVVKVPKIVFLRDMAVVVKGRINLFSWPLVWWWASCSSSASWSRMMWAVAMGCVMLYFLSYFV